MPAPLFPPPFRDQILGQPSPPFFFPPHSRVHHRPTPPHPTPAQQIARLGSLHSTLLPLLTPSTFSPPLAPPPPRRPAARSAQQGCPPPRIELPIRAGGVAAGAGGLGRGLREAGDGGGREWFRGGRSAGPVAGDGLLRREAGQRGAGSGRAPAGLRRDQGLHRVPHHQDPALARGTLRAHVAVQRVRDPVPEEETGGDGPRLQQQGRRRQRAPAAAAEEEGHGRRRRRRRGGVQAGAREGEGGGRGHRGAPRRGVRQGGGAEAAAADAPEAAPRRGGARGHPAHGALLRRRVRLTSYPHQTPHPKAGTAAAPVLLLQAADLLGMQHDLSPERSACISLCQPFPPGSMLSFPG